MKVKLVLEVVIVDPAAGPASIAVSGAVWVRAALMFGVIWLAVTATGVACRWVGALSYHSSNQGSGVTHDENHTKWSPAGKPVIA